MEERGARLGRKGDGGVVGLKSHLFGRKVKEGG